MAEQEEMIEGQNPPTKPRDFASLLKDIYNHYDPNNNLEDSYFTKVADKYQGNEAEILKKIYNHYDPNSGLGDDYFNKVAQKYAKVAPTPEFTPTIKPQVDFTQPVAAAKEVLGVSPIKTDEGLVQLADKYGYGKLQINELMDKAVDAVQSGDAGTISAFSSGIDQVIASSQAGLKGIMDELAKSSIQPGGGIAYTQPAFREAMEKRQETERDIKLLESKGYFKKGGVYEKSLYRSLVANKKFRTALEAKGLDPDATLADALKGDTEGFWQRLSMGVAQTAPQIVGQIGAGFVGGLVGGPVTGAAAAGAFMGSQVYGGRLLEGLVEDQKITDEDRIAATGAAIAEFGAESLLGPVAKVGGKLAQFLTKSGRQVADQAVNRGAGKQVLDFVANAFKKGAGEAGEEMLVTGLNPMIEVAAKAISQEDPNFDYKKYIEDSYGEGFFDEMLEAGLVGFATGAATAIVPEAKAKPTEQAPTTAPPTVPPTETEFAPELEMTPEQSSIAVGVRSFLDTYTGDVNQTDEVFEAYVNSFPENERDLIRGQETQIKDVLSILANEREALAELEGAEEEVPVTEQAPDFVQEEVAPIINRDEIVQEIESNLSPTALEVEGFDRITLEEYVQKRIDEGLTKTEIKERVKEDFGDALQETYVVDDISKVEFDRVMRGETPQQTTIDRLASKLDDPNLSEREKAVLDKIRETPETFARVEEKTFKDKVAATIDPIIKAISENQSPEIQQIARDEVTNKVVQGKKEGKDLDTIFDELVREYEDVVPAKTLAPIVQQTKNTIKNNEAINVLNTGTKSSLLDDGSNDQLVVANQTLQQGTPEQRATIQSLIDDTRKKGTDITQYLPYINNPAAIKSLQDNAKKKIDPSQVNNVAATLADEVMSSNPNVTFEQIKNEVADLVDKGITQDVLVKKIFDKYKVAKPILDSNLFKTIEQTVETEGSIEFSIDELGQVADDEKNGVRFFFNKLMEKTIISAAMAADPNSKSDLATLPKLIRAFGKYLTGKKVVIHKDRKALMNYMESNQLNVNIPDKQIGGFLFRDTVHIVASEADNTTTTHEFLHIFFRDLIRNNPDYAQALIEKLKAVQGFQKVFENVTKTYADIYTQPHMFLEEALVTFFSDVVTKPIKVQRSIFEQVINAINSILKAAGIDWKVENVNVTDFALGLQAAIQGGYLIERNVNKVTQNEDANRAIQVASPEALPMMINHFLIANPELVNTLDGVIKIKSVDALRDTSPLDTPEKRLAYANAILDIIKTASNAFFKNTKDAEVFVDLGEFILQTVQNYVQRSADPIIPDSLVRFAEVYNAYKNQQPRYSKVKNIDTAFGAVTLDAAKSIANFDAFKGGNDFLSWFSSSAKNISNLSSPIVFTAYADTEFDKTGSDFFIDLESTPVLLKRDVGSKAGEVGHKVYVKMNNPAVVGTFDQHENSTTTLVDNYTIPYDVQSQAADIVAQRTGQTPTEAIVNNPEEVTQEAIKILNKPSALAVYLEAARQKHEKGYDPTDPKQVTNDTILKSYVLDVQEKLSARQIYNVIINNATLFPDKLTATKIVKDVLQSFGFDGLIITDSRATTDAKISDYLIVPFNTTAIKTEYGEDVTMGETNFEYPKYEYEVNRSGQAVDKMDLGQYFKNRKIYDALKLEGRVLDYFGKSASVEYTNLINKGINVVQYHPKSLINSNIEFTSSDQIRENFDNIIAVNLSLQKADVPQVVQHIFDLLKIGGKGYIHAEKDLAKEDLQRFAEAIVKTGGKVSVEKIAGFDVLTIEKTAIISDAPAFQIIGAKGLQTKLSATKQITGDKRDDSILQVKEEVRNLRLAQTMRSLSIHPEIIKKATGWEFTIFNSWNKVITPTLITEKGKNVLLSKWEKKGIGSYEIKDFVDENSDLFKYYPKLKNVTVKIIKKTGGSYETDPDIISIGNESESTYGRSVNYWENLPTVKQLIDDDPNQYNSGILNLFQYLVDDLYDNYTIDDLPKLIDSSSLSYLDLMIDKFSRDQNYSDFESWQNKLYQIKDFVEINYIAKKARIPKENVHNLIKNLFNSNQYWDTIYRDLFKDLKKDKKQYVKNSKNEDSFLAKMAKQFYFVNAIETLRHEIQHYIQYKEGWYRGGNSNLTGFGLVYASKILKGEGNYKKAIDRLDSLDKAQQEIKEKYKLISDLKAKGDLKSTIKAKAEEQKLYELQESYLKLRQSPLLEKIDTDIPRENLFVEYLATSHISSGELLAFRFYDFINNPALKQFLEKKDNTTYTQEEYLDKIEKLKNISYQAYLLLAGETQARISEVAGTELYANVLLDFIADQNIKKQLEIDSTEDLAKNSLIKFKEYKTKDIVDQAGNVTAEYVETQSKAVLPYEGNIRPGGVATLSPDFSKKMEIDTLIEVSNRIGSLMPTQFTGMMHIAKLAARVIDDPSPINIDALNQFLNVYNLKEDATLKKIMDKAAKTDPSINFANLATKIANLPKAGITQDTGRRIYELALSNVIKTHNAYTGSDVELNTTDPEQPMFKITEEVKNMDAVDKIVAVESIGIDDRRLGVKTKIGVAEFRKELYNIHDDVYNMTYGTLARINSVLSTSHPEQRQQEFTAITDAITFAIGALKSKTSGDAVKAGEMIRAIPKNKIDDWQFQTLLETASTGTPTDNFLYKFIEKSFEFLSDPKRNEDYPAFQLSPDEFERIENEKRAQRRTTARERAISNFIKEKDADPKVSDIQIMEGLMNAYGMTDVQARRELEFVLKRKYVPVPSNFGINYRKTLAKTKAFRWRAFKEKGRDALRWYTFTMQDDNEIVRKTEEQISNQIAEIRAAQQVAVKYGLTMQNTVSGAQQALELYPKEVKKLKKEYAKQVNIYDEVESPWATKVTANGRTVYFEAEVMQTLFGSQPGEVGAKAKIDDSLIGKAKKAGIGYEELNSFLFFRHIPEFIDRKNELIRQIRDKLMNDMLDIQAQMVDNADAHKQIVTQLRNDRNLATTPAEKQRITDQIDKEDNKFYNKNNALKAKVDEKQNELDKEYNQFIFSLGFDNTNTNNPSPITKKYAEDKLNELVTKHPEIEKFSDDIRDYLLNGYLDILETEGLIDVERLVALRNGTDSRTNVDWKYYIPMRVKDDVAKDLVFDANTMFSQSGMPGVYTLEGGGGRQFGKQDRFDPIGQMFINLIAAKQVAERNNATRTFADFIKRLKISGFGIVAANNILVTVNSSLELDDNGNKIQPGISVDNTSDAPEYIEDGKKYKIVALNQKTRNSFLYKSYQKDKPLGLGDTNLWMRYMSFARTLITSANLAFGFNQIVPDALEGGINSSIDISVQQKVSRTKLTKSFANNWRKSMQFFLGEGFRALTNGQATGEIAQAYIDFQKYGGKMSWRRITGDNLKQYTEITKIIKEVDEGIFIGRAGARKIKSAIMNSTDAMENMARFAAFLTAKQYGLDNIRAAAVAKESTLNFEAKGRSNLYRLAKVSYLFIGPALKSPQRAARTLFYGGAKLSLAAIIAAAVNRMFLYLATEDEDELDRKINNSYANQNRFTIPIPIQGKPDASVKLPYGWLRIANAVGIGLVDIANGKRSEGDMIEDMIVGLMGLFDPVSGSASWTNFMPTPILKAALQVSVNSDYNSRPIISPFIVERADFLKDAYDKSTPIAYIQFAEWLDQKGLADWSPAYIQYFLEQTLLYPGITKPLASLNEASKLLTGARPTDEFVAMLNEDFEPQEEVDINKLIWFGTSFYRASDEDISDVINFFEFDKQSTYAAVGVRRKVTEAQFDYYVKVYNKLYQNEMVSKQALNSRMKSWQSKYPEDDKGNTLNWEAAVEYNKRRDKLLKKK